MDEKLEQFIRNQLFDYIFTLGIEDFSDCLISALKEKGLGDVCVDKNEDSVRIVYTFQRRAG
jgi:hypothetical protein